MKSPQFEALVQRMADFAQSSPRAYRWWVYALAAFGFACLLLLIVVLLGILVLLLMGARHATAIAIKFIVVVGALLLVVLKALWVRLEPPAGEVLRGSDAPQFFALLDQLLGQADRARLWHERFVERTRASEEAKRERARLVRGDTWLEHGLDAETLAPLVASLKQIPGLRRAYLVRKRVTHQPQRPLYVLGFSATVLGFTGEARTKEVMERLRTAVAFPGETLIINIEGANQHFGHEFRALATARIV